ncbi:MAG: hypothetical protein EA357_02790 [Micavibrio sp.]|nr:MAG: hypothetical protein EA357_02790 [Micavibrio sp.]
MAARGESGAFMGDTKDKRGGKKNGTRLSEREVGTDFGRNSEKNHARDFSLISDPLKEYFLNYVPDGATTLAQQRLHELDVAAQNVMRYHLDYALESVDIDMDSDMPEEEKNRLAQFYARNPLFAKAREDYQTACLSLTALNKGAAIQVIGHVQDAINDVVETMQHRKHHDALRSHPFAPPSHSGKTPIH